MNRIESFLSARQFIKPQLIDNRIFFMSNLSGHQSLFAMDQGGSIPLPLLPPHIALQNPHLLVGESFYVFPKIRKILVIIDNDGDEDYTPMFIPIDGGYPEPAFRSLENHKVFMYCPDREKNILYFVAASHKEPIYFTYRADLFTSELIKLFQSGYGGIPDGNNNDHSKVIINEEYFRGDHTIYLWGSEEKKLKVLYGIPYAEREPERDFPLNGIKYCHFFGNDKNLLFRTTIFNDEGSLAYIDIDHPIEAYPVSINGINHQGRGELTRLNHLRDNHYLVRFNIDGCDWAYEGTLDDNNMEINITKSIVGQGLISSGVLEHIDFEEKSDTFAISFSTARSPTQIYTIDRKNNTNIIQHTG